jgi:Flp pilus assembly protein TadG
MKPLESTRGHGDRGFALIAMALFILAFLGLTAIAVEISRLTHTATEVQASADSAALSAAAALAKHLNEVTGGQNAATANNADGHAIAASSVLIEKGHYDSSAGASTHFSTSCTANVDCNAVKATVTVDNVNYIMGSILDGQSGTNVLKNAVAAVGCPSSSYPWPLAVCSSALSQIGRDDTCGSFSGPITMNPNASSNSCWTSLGTASASSSNTQAIFPAQCGGAPIQAWVQESINLTGGVASSVWQAMQCCIACQNIHDFTVAVVDCAGGTCGGSSTPIVGFATIHIADASDVNRPGGGTTTCSGGSFRPWGDCPASVTSPPGVPTGITATQVCKSDLPGGPGGSTCHNFGTTVSPRLGQLP